MNTDKSVLPFVRWTVFAPICAVVLALGLTYAFAGDPPKSPTIRQALDINAALQATGCQPGIVARDGSKETPYCRTFDYVADKGKTGFSRQIADWGAAVREAVDGYNKANNQRVAAFDDKGNSGRYRNKDGDLTQEALAQLAVWRDAYLDGDAFLGGRPPPPHFKRSDLEAVGFQPPILTALRPITDIDN